MHGSLHGAERASNKYAAASGQEFFLPTPSGDILPPDKWFMRIAHSLWKDKPGAWIRSLTGFPDRTCRAAASGETGVSSEMLYALLRGEQGERVIDAIMEGSAVDWWRNLQRAKRKTAAHDAA